MGEEDMRRIAGWISRALDNTEDEAALEKIANEVADFARAFPLHVGVRIPNM
jgi:glycine hydroxymethyltransferase